MGALTLGVNASRDLFLTTSGSLSAPTDQQAISQMLIEVLSTFKGELLFNLRGGISYRETVFATGDDAIPLLQDDIVKTVEAQTGVISVTAIQIWQNENILRFELQIVTIYGNVSLAGNL